jgi:hypothetical protein
VYFLGSTFPEIILWTSSLSSVSKLIFHPPILWTLQSERRHIVLAWWEMSPRGVNSAAALLPSGANSLELTTFTAQVSGPDTNTEGFLLCLSWHNILSSELKYRLRKLFLWKKKLYLYFSCNWIDRDQYPVKEILLFYACFVSISPTFLDHATCAYMNDW